VPSVVVTVKFNVPEDACCGVPLNVAVVPLRLYVIPFDRLSDDDAIQFEPEYAGEETENVIGYTYDADGFARERATVND
jgi:hypothetical protein